MDPLRLDHRDSPLPTGSGLRQFIPPVLYRWPGFPERHEHEVATLFIDVAGFTRLSEMLVSLGPEGAEILERTIARYFDALLDVIDPFKGLPIKISGDALTVVFPTQGGALREAAVRALACAEAMRRAGRKVATVMVRGTPFSLAHKIGVGGGRLLSGVVGDPRLRSEYIFAGEALDSAVAAEHHAQAGEVWVAPHIVQLLERPSWWSRTDTGGYCRLRDEPDLELRTAQRLVDPAFLAEVADVEEFLARYAALIPPAAREHAAKGALNYLCRHQNLTVIFAGCPGLVIDRAESLQQLDAHYRRMQMIVEQYGGFLSEFEAGDKGAKVIVLFGAPTMLEDPCGQAARCAQAMQQAAREMGIVKDQRMGLTTGRLYVGRIGCRSLVKYSALGDRMNLSARLMTAASRWQVLADQYTVEHSRQSVRWGAPASLKVKGKEEPVNVSSLLLTRVSRTSERRGRGLVGRTQEQQLATRLVGSLIQRKGGLLLMEGPAGIGKTRLVEALSRIAAERPQVRILRWSGGNSVFQAGPLNAWRPLLLDLIGAVEPLSASELELRFRTWRGGLPQELQRSADLLASLLGISWTLDAALSHIPPDRLIVLRGRALIECLQHALPQGAPRLLVLDNAERLDGPSITTLQELVPLLGDLPLLVAVSARPQPADRADSFAPLKQLPAVKRLELKPLTAREATRLACRRLKVKRLDSELEAHLMARAQGNPLRIESWLDAMLNHGQVRVLDNVACWNGTCALETLPDRLEALILTQLERLPPEAQLTVRVASVIGQSFTAAEVSALHPERLPEATVAAHLHLANLADILWYDRTNPGRLFFSRPEVLDAIHDSLPFHLRRMLHAHQVKLLTSSLPERPDGDQVLGLAQHYEYIEDLEARRQIFSQAADVARDRYDHLGTVRWARRVLEVCEALEDHSGFLAAASQLHQALFLLGENEERQQLVRRWVEAAERVHDRYSLLDALRSSAKTLQRIGDREGAAADLERALKVARELNDPLALFDTLTTASAVQGEVGQSLLSLEHADEALKCAQACEPARLFRAYFQRGFAFSQLGRLKEANENYHKALELCELADDFWNQALTLGNIAVVLWGMGHPEEGHSSLLKALELKRRVGDRREIGLGLLNVGFSFSKLGDLQKARSYTEEAVRLFRQTGYPRGELIAVSNLGEILWLSGSFAEADECYSRCEKLLAQHPNEPLRVELWIREGELNLTQQQWLEAERCFEKALDRARALKLVGFQCNALEGLAELKLGIADLEGAWSLMRSALELLQTDEHLVAFPQRVWWRAARIALECGRYEEALEMRGRAVQLLKQEQKSLTSQTARNRLAKAFPWNRAIMRDDAFKSYIPREMAEQLLPHGTGAA